MRNHENYTIGRSEEEAFSFDDFVTGKIIKNVADIKCYRNEYQSAYSIYDVECSIKRDHFGPEHHETILALFNAGKCLHCVGKVNTACRYYDLIRGAVLTMKPETLTKDIVLALQSIAWMFHKQGSYSKAKAFYELALGFSLRVFGKVHGATARILNQCGNLNFEVGDMHLALKCYKEGLTIENSLASSDKNQDPDILTTLSNIAQTYEALGELQKSLNCHMQIVAMLRSCRASMTRSQRLEQAATVLMNIAHLQRTMGRPDQALRALTDALQIQKLQFGDNHTNVAVTLNEMGIVYGSQGKLNLSLQCFEESVRIRKNCPNIAELDLCPVIYNMAHCYVEQGDFKRAISMYEQVFQLEVVKQSNAEADKNSEWSAEVLFDTLEHMANIFQSKLCEPLRGLACYEKGLEMLSKLGTDKVSHVIQSRFLSRAGHFFLDLGVVDRAIRLFSQAMRVNIRSGWRYNRNIETSGFTIAADSSQKSRGAPAA